MDDKKFLILLTVFGVVFLVLVLSFAAVVVLDSTGHKNPAKVSNSGGHASSLDAASLLNLK